MARGGRWRFACMGRWEGAWRGAEVGGRVLAALMLLRCLLFDLLLTARLGFGHGDKEGSCGIVEECYMRYV